MNNIPQTATFGGGCFWCTEAFFRKLKGVISVKPGYSGGDIVDPSYEDVCTGKTGHAEVIQIEFDPDEISYEKLLDVFFHTHNPTTLNRQGGDKGTQYRSVIFYHDENQKKVAEKYISDLKAKKEFADEIVTDVLPLKNFYESEDYHKNYFEKNQNAPYCEFIIAPKVDSLKKKYPNLLQ